MSPPTPSRSCEISTPKPAYLKDLYATKDLGHVVFAHHQIERNESEKMSQFNLQTIEVGRFEKIRPFMSILRVI